MMLKHVADNAVGNPPQWFVDCDDPFPHNKSVCEGNGADTVFHHAVNEHWGEQLMCPIDAT
jgi:hypothetical protein